MDGHRPAARVCCIVCAACPSASSRVRQRSRNRILALKTGQLPFCAILAIGIGDLSLAKNEEPHTTSRLSADRQSLNV